jgi:hypothetical protein
MNPFFMLRLVGGEVHGRRRFTGPCWTGDCPNPSRRLLFQVIDYSAAFAANASTTVMFEINSGGKP